jgi:hypothetical protein
MLGYSEWQSVVLALVPKFTGTLSLLSSTYIVQHVLMSRSKRRKTYHRILVGMSINDILGSFFSATLSTWPMPATNIGADLDIFGAVGSVKTCTMAGFFNQGGNLAAPLYNGSLSTFYLLMIVYGWKEHALKKKVEPYFHIIPNMVGWGTGILGLALRAYGPADWTCWIAPYPSGCDSKVLISGDDYDPDSPNSSSIPCERGVYYFAYRMAFRYGILWLCILYVTIVMWVVYVTVLTTEKASSKYQYPSFGTTSLPGNNQSSRHRRVSFEDPMPDSDLRNSIVLHASYMSQHSRSSSAGGQYTLSTTNTANRQKSKRIANQALLYVGALVLTTVFDTAVRISQKNNYVAPFTLMLCEVIFTPLQGFYNLCIYLRPRYLQYAKLQQMKHVQQQQEILIQQHQQQQDTIIQQHQQQMQQHDEELQVAPEVDPIIGIIHNIPSRIMLARFFRHTFFSHANVRRKRHHRKAERRGGASRVRRLSVSLAGVVRAGRGSLSNRSNDEGDEDLDCFGESPSPAPKGNANTNGKIKERQTLSEKIRAKMALEQQRRARVVQSVIPPQYNNVTEAVHVQTRAPSSHTTHYKPSSPAPLAVAPPTSQSPPSPSRMMNHVPLEEAVNSSASHHYVDVHSSASASPSKSGSLVSFPTALGIIVEPDGLIEDDEERVDDIVADNIPVEYDTLYVQPEQQFWNVVKFLPAGPSKAKPWLRRGHSNSNSGYGSSLEMGSDQSLSQSQRSIPTSVLDKAAAGGVGTPTRTHLPLKSKAKVRQTSVPGMSFSAAHTHRRTGSSRRRSSEGDEASDIEVGHKLVLTASEPLPLTEPGGQEPSLAPEPLNNRNPKRMQSRSSLGSNLPSDPSTIIGRRQNSMGMGMDNTRIYKWDRVSCRRFSLNSSNHSHDADSDADEAIAQREGDSEYQAAAVDSRSLEVDDGATPFASDNALEQATDNAPASSILAPSPQRMAEKDPPAASPLGRTGSIQQFDVVADIGASVSAFASADTSFATAVGVAVSPRASLKTSTGAGFRTDTVPQEEEEQQQSVLLHTRSDVSSTSASKLQDSRTHHPFSSGPVSRSVVSRLALDRSAHSDPAAAGTGRSTTNDQGPMANTKPKPKLRAKPPKPPKERRRSNGASAAAAALEISSLGRTATASTSNQPSQQRPKSKLRPKLIKTKSSKS